MSILNFFKNNEAVFSAISSIATFVSAYATLRTVKEMQISREQSYAPDFFICSSAHFTFCNDNISGNQELTISNIGLGVAKNIKIFFSSAIIDNNCNFNDIEQELDELELNINYLAHNLKKGHKIKLPFFYIKKICYSIYKQIEDDESGTTPSIDILISFSDTSGNTHKKKFIATPVVDVKGIPLFIDITFKIEQAPEQ